MSTESIVALVILILALALLILNAAAEAGIMNLSRSRARLLLSRDPDNPRAHLLQRTVQGREEAFAALTVGLTLALVTGFAAALYLAIREFGFGWKTVLISGAVAFVVLTWSQSVPRRWASANPEGFGLRFAPVMHWLERLFALPAAIFEAPAALLLRLGRWPAPAAATSLDLEVLLEQEEGAGIEEEEREMIRGVIEIGETSVREAMVPRPDIVAVEVNVPLRQAAQVVIESGVSRLPVYEGSIDNVIGMLYAKDVLGKIATEGESAAVRDVMRSPLFVPESKRVDEMLAEFRKSRVHIAIVLDEYGGTAGLVTMEDLLEEIVGEIEDEYDHSAVPVIRVSEDEAILDGRASLDHLEECFGWRPAGEEFETVGGLVFDRLGKVPEVGDTVQANGLQFAVVSMEGRRIAKVRVRRQPDDATPPTDATAGAA